MSFSKKQGLGIVLMTIFIVLLLSLIITPTVFYRAQWSYSNIIGAEIIEEESFLDIPDYEENPYLYETYGKLINQMEGYPGIQYLLTIVSLLTGLSIVTIYSFFPLGEILIILAAFFVAEIFFSDSLHKKYLLVLLSSIGIFGPSMLRIDFHVLQTSIMIFTFCLSLWAIYKCYIKNNYNYIWIIVFLLLLNRVIYFSSSIFYYVFLTIFSFYLLIFSYFQNKKNKKNLRAQSSIYIASSIFTFFTWINLNIFTYLLSITKILFFLGGIFILGMIVLFILLAKVNKKRAIEKLTKLTNKLLSNIHYLIIPVIIVSPIIFLVLYNNFSMLESTLSYRFFSLMVIIPSFFVIPFLLKDYLDNKKNIKNIFYIFSITSILGLLIFSLYMPYLITRGLVFLQVIFFVGIIIFFSDKRWFSKKTSNYLFLILVLLLIFNNFTYLISPDNNYASSNDLRVVDGLSSFLEEISKDEIICSDLKILSNSIVLGHDASYLPFISKGEFEDLEDYLYLIFYDEDPATTYDIMVENEVDYLILTEEMTEYGIYVHDYQHDPISNVFIENLEESIYFSKVFSNSGLIVFKVN